MIYIVKSAYVDNLSAPNSPKTKRGANGKGGVWGGIFHLLR